MSRGSLLLPLLLVSAVLETGGSVVSDAASAPDLDAGYVAAGTARPPSISENALWDENDHSADTRMRRDLHRAAVAMEEFYEPNHDCYTGATLADLQKAGFRPSDGVTLTILDASDQHYRLETRAEGGVAKSWIFDSSNARMTPVMP